MAERREDDDELDIDQMADSVVEDLLGPSDEEQDPKKVSSPQNPTPGEEQDEEEEEREVSDQAEDTPEGETPPATDPSPDIPRGVPQELAAKWKDVPQEFKDFYKKREKDFLDGTEHFRRAAAFGQELHEVINPYLPYIQSRTYADGRPVSPKDAIGFLLNAEYQLQTGSPQQKVAMLARLAKDYGVDLTQVQQAATSEIDPTIQPFVQKVEALESTLTNWQQQQLIAQRNAVQAEVQAFAADKAAHPYFEELTEDIVALCRAGFKLAEAYERAVWANPVTRAKEQARLDKEREEKAKKEAEERRQKALRLKRQNVRSTPTNRRPTAPAESMDDTLRSTYREIQSRNS